MGMILSIDTFSEILGISLIDGHKLVLRQSYEKLKPFSELLMEKIDVSFKQLGYEPSVLYAVVVNKGPGAFTGLRVGITVAKTISYSLNIPIYTYGSLEAMAFKYRFYNGEITTAINAGKGECYVGKFYADFEGINKLEDIKLKKIKDFKEEKHNGLVVVKNIDISGEKVVHLIEDLSVDGAFYALKNHLIEDPFKLEPLYIRSL